MLFSARVEYVCMIAIVGLVTTNVEGVPFYRQFSKRSDHHKQEIRSHMVALINLLDNRTRYTGNLRGNQSLAVNLPTPYEPPIDNVAEEHRRHYEALHEYTNILNNLPLSNSDRSIADRLNFIKTEIHNLAVASPSWGTFTPPSTTVSSFVQNHPSHLAPAILEYVLQKLNSYINNGLSITVHKYTLPSTP
ncbi:uncharacterized protein LOC117102384 isoform X2 [Anneissia japonica]|uniref:uncharacterized protein LOC117102384 isoform X2 n=1 Tax=Anneissia japonica TaxID=1529436 RepID=UPI0014257DA4|nr:uncharacterized protein LOC117102384 isoform X2 [Anneissia japonica]